MKTPYRVYVLQNWAGKLYIGLSENPGARLEQHNAGVSQWTRGKGPWNMLWLSEPMELGQARKLENHLKRQKGGRGLQQFVGLSNSSGS